MGERSAGKDTVHHTKVHKVGHRTQCQGQNGPGRRKRNLLTRPTKKREAALGVGSSPCGEASKSVGVSLQRPAAGESPLNTLAGHTGLEACRGGWREVLSLGEGG